MSAPIRFHCPHCQALMQANAGTSGKKCLCTSCGQKILIPAAALPLSVVTIPAPRVTTLGVLAAEEPLVPLVVVPPPLPLPVPLPSRPRDDDDDSDLEYRPRRRKRRRREEDEDDDDQDDGLTRRRRPMLVEQTSKGWKLVQLLGTLAVIVGGVWMVVVCSGVGNLPGQPDAPKSYATPALIAFAGLAVLIFARIGAWWDHG